MLIETERQLQAALKFRAMLNQVVLYAGESFDESVLYEPAIGKECGFFDGEKFSAVTGNYESENPADWVYPIRTFDEKFSN